jgi:hypothetical protein
VNINHRATRFTLSEDWLATLVGLGIVLIIAAGVVGPGPQSASLRAQPGALSSALVMPIGGWQISATLAGEKLTVVNAISTSTSAPLSLSFAAGQTYQAVCRAGQLTLEGVTTLTTFPAGLSAPDSGQAQVALRNECEAEVALTLRTPTALPWPVFRLFQ